MIITTVELKNYRVHESRVVEFDQGINLLIGQNGAGKSSILEAIGFALFDSDLRSKGSDRAIRYGAKTATIIVWFTANDGNEYRVERRIGTSPRWHLFFGDEKAPRYDRKDQILPLMRTLSGIHQNENQIFTTVICAVQNRFVDMFNLTGQPRSDLFDKLFDTDIYRKLNNSFTGGDDSIVSFYKEQRDRLEGQISSLEELGIDENALQNEIFMQNEELIAKKNERIVKETNKKEIEEKYTAVTESLRHLSTLEQEVQYLQKELTNHSATLELTKLKIGEAELSAKIIVENSHNFQLYQELAQKRTALETTLAEESKIRKSFDEATKTISLCALEIEKFRGEMSTIQARREISSDQRLQAERDLALVSAQLMEKENDLVSILELGRQSAQFAKQYDELLALLTNCEDSQTQYRNKIEELSIEISSAKGLDDNRKVLLLEMEDLEIQEKQLKLIEDQIRHKEISLSTLLDAQKSIGNGLCPILNESCKNVVGTNGTYDYFLRKSDEIQSSKDILKNQRDQYFDLVNNIQQNRTKLAELNVKIQSAKDAENQVMLLQSKVELELERFAHYIASMKLIEPNISVENNHKLHFNNRLTVYQEERVRLLQVHKESESARNELRNKKQSLEQTIQALTDSISNFTLNYDNLSQQIPLTLEKQQQTELHHHQFAMLLAQFEQTHNEIAIISESMSYAEVGYQLVLENRELAGRIEELRASEQHIMKLQSETQQRHTFILGELGRYSKEILVNDQKNIAIDQQIVRSAITELSERITLLSERIRYNNETIQKAYAQRNRIKFLQKDLAVFIRKQELTELFRKNVNDMGRFVVAGIVETIAYEATEHFRQFTGRPEKISWIVEELDKYAVYLTLGEGENQFRRDFSVLSGGEQVAVALSLRSALARELSSADFAIFDEPTVNLDSERKVALAESLKSMVGMLGQTIIVTHDDLFREMAQKVIEL